MRKVLIVLSLSLASLSLGSQQTPPSTAAGPTNPKAIKTFQEAQREERQGESGFALSDYKKADKQDGGRCFACQQKMIAAALASHDWKSGIAAAQEQVAEASPGANLALAHDQVANFLYVEAMSKKRPKPAEFAPVHQELLAALRAYANYPGALLLDGEVLVRMHQDGAARADFNELVKLEQPSNVDRQRAERYLSNISLVTARMAPPFAIQTMDGRRVTLDSLKGKVVLVDFWATWCAPCRAALPHMKKIAQEFKGKPLVMISVSLDQNRKTWRDYVLKNGMTWLNTYDGYWNGPMAKLFYVRAIPQTFSIDANGVLQDQKIADLAIDGKLKKLVAQAEALDSRSASSRTAER